MFSRSSSRVLSGALALAMSVGFAGHGFGADGPTGKPNPTDKEPATAGAIASIKLPDIEKAEYVPGEGFKVNGKPFFPIMLYSAKTSPQELAEFRKRGYNVLTVNKPEDAENAAKGGFYIAQHAYPKKPPTQLQATLFGIAMDSPVLNFQKDVIEKTKKDLAKVQELIPNRPVFNAIGYWLNEPDGVKSNTLPDKERYEDVVNAIDVSAPYLYPVPYQPTSTVGDAVARAKTASGAKKAVLPILQMFTWTANDRYPTNGELAEMVWSAVATGADGVGYYDYSYVTGKKDTNIAKEQPALWAAAGDINAELAKFMGKTAGLKETAPTVTINGKAWARQWTNDKRMVLLVVNASNEPVQIAVERKIPGGTNQSLKKFTPQSTGPVTVTGGEKAELAPHTKYILLVGDPEFLKN